MKRNWIRERRWGGDRRVESLRRPPEARNRGYRRKKSVWWGERCRENFLSPLSTLVLLFKRSGHKVSANERFLTMTPKTSLFVDKKQEIRSKSLSSENKSTKF
ncbi:hypothetical protein YC2023_093545 [Brassica napus]